MISVICDVKPVKSLVKILETIRERKDEKRLKKLSLQRKSGNCRTQSPAFVIDSVKPALSEVQFKFEYVWRCTMGRGGVKTKWRQDAC